MKISETKSLEDRLPAPPLAAIAAAFLWLGTTSFGGMWGSAAELERELVVRRPWVRPDELNLLLVTATLVPAPRYLALAALVGYRLRGLGGAAVAATALVLPSALIVLAGVAWIRPELLGGPLAEMEHWVTLGVSGVLFGSAWRQVRMAYGRAGSWLGVAVGLGVAVAISFGAPVVLAVPAGLVVAVFLLRGGAGA